MEGVDTAADAVPPDTVARFRRWAAIAVAVAALLYIGYALWRGIGETKDALVSFHWPTYLVALALTGVNYGLRYWKWQWLLRRVGVEVPHAANVWIFLAGLAMVISPGKAGEVLKPYLVGVVNGAPMTRTIPVLVAERGTDGIAVVVLAALGVSTFYAEGAWIVAITAAAIVAALLTIAIKPLSMALIGLWRHLPLVGRFADRLEASYIALRTCLSPGAFALTMAVSLVAWWAECVGYWLIFRGLDVAAGLEASTFLYAFATLFGGAMPGGMGMADGALVEGSMLIVPGIGIGDALAAALLVRVATLWFGVILGAFALVRMESVIAQHRVTHR